jgi:tRNA A37 methylthiotransferase MiaB
MKSSPVGVAGAVLDAPRSEPETAAERKHVYVETYGCQMNVNDSEVMLSVLKDGGYDETDDMHDADVILVNTCAIREKAEAKIWQRLAYFKSLRKRKKKSEKPVVGVLGCMAERLKTKLLEADQLADLVAGPDAYRDLPNLIGAVNGGEKAMNVQLSVEETYADIVPVRKEGAHAAFVTIMRGCDNACSFCIVPYTRGRERSRDPASIEYEVRLLSEQGVKEVTLLGQNVNSYAYSDEVTGGGETDFLSMLSAGNDDGKTREEDVVDPESVAKPPGMSAEVAAAGGTPFVGYAEGFSSRYRADKRREGSVQFAALLDRVAAIDPEMRVRFTSPHPKDFPDEVLEVIARRPNVCNCLHMPAQSGNTRTLENMARGYTREAYLNLIDRVKAKIPGCAVTTDIIVGFCGETEEEHEDTVTLMDRVAYEQAFMFAYSERDGTSAARKMEDDVPEDVKQRRLQEVIDAFRGAAARHQEAEIGRVHLCTVEGASKKNDQELTGKTDTSKWVVFANDPVGVYGGDVGEELVGGEKKSVVVNGGAGEKLATPEPGEYVAVRVTGCSTGTLFGECLGRTTLTAFHEKHGYAWVEPEASGKKATAAAGAR